MPKKQSEPTVIASIDEDLYIWIWSEFLLADKTLFSIMHKTHLTGNVHIGFRPSINWVSVFEENHLIDVSHRHDDIIEKKNLHFL